jgi:acetyl esterase/lipase
MTLSRKAIRPIQTQHLLANGLLPVSIDYRLCPEVSLVDGPMTDVYDAYQWTRTTLPRIATQHGFTVNSNKVVIVGWSTGGQLAMSIGWKAKMTSIPPPTAVLSFYAPVDFESGGMSPEICQTDACRESF